MTNDLYRKQAVEHSTRSLYGEVILTGPPGSWLVTLLLIFVMAIIAGLLIWAKVDGTPLWQWLSEKAA